MTQSEPNGISFPTFAMPVPLLYKLWPTGSRSLSEFKNRCTVYVKVKLIIFGEKHKVFTVAVFKVTIEKFRPERNLNPEPMRYWYSAPLVYLS